MSVIVDFSIFPVDKGSSVSTYVARAVRHIRESGLAFKLTPMGTCIEGDWEAVMAVVTRSFKDLQNDCDRVYMTLKVDYRRGQKERLVGKVASVEAKL